MKQLRFFGTRTLVSILCSLFAISSCVKEEYDLSDDNLNSEINLFDNGVTLPLGQTEQITMRDLLKDFDNNVLTVGEDGVYSISYQSVLEEKLPSVADKLEVPNIEFTEELKLNFAKSSPYALASDIPLSTLTTEISQDFEFELYSGDKLPKEILELQKMELEDTYVNFSLTLPNISPEGVSLSADLVVTLPKVINLEGMDSDGKVILKGKFAENGKLEFSPVKVNSLDFSNYDLSQGVRVKGNLAGSFTLEINTLDFSNWIGKEPDLNLNIEIKDIKIAKAWGRVDYSIEPVTQTVDLNALSDLFRDSEDDVKLDFYNAGIALDLKTNFGVPAILLIELIPSYEGKPNYSKKVSTRLPINSSESSDKEVSTKYWIADMEKGCPAGYQFIKADVTYLLDDALDQLIVKISASSDPNAISVIETTADYSLKVDYSFDLPLAFGENFEMSYTETMDLPQIVKNILSSGTKLMLTGRVENSLPLGFELNLNLLDRNGERIELLQGNGVQIIDPCKNGGEASSTELSLLIALAEDKKDIAKLEIVINARPYNATGIGVREDAYMQASLKAVFPEGIIIDTNQITEEQY